MTWLCQYSPCSKLKVKGPVHPSTSTKGVVLDSNYKIRVLLICSRDPIFDRFQGHRVYITIHATISKEYQIANKIGAQDRILKIHEDFHYVLPMRELLADVAFSSVLSDDLIAVFLVNLHP